MIPKKVIKLQDVLLTDAKQKRSSFNKTQLFYVSNYSFWDKKIRVIVNAHHVSSNGHEITIISHQNNGASKQTYSTNQFLCYQERLLFHLLFCLCNFSCMRSAFPCKRKLSKFVPNLSFSNFTTYKSFAIVNPYRGTNKFWQNSRSSWPNFHIRKALFVLLKFIQECINKGKLPYRLFFGNWIKISFLERIRSRLIRSLREVAQQWETKWASRVLGLQGTNVQS